MRVVAILDIAHEATSNTPSAYISSKRWIVFCLRFKRLKGESLKNLENASANSPRPILSTKTIALKIIAETHLFHALGFMGFPKMASSFTRKHLSCNEKKKKLYAPQQLPSN